MLAVLLFTPLHATAQTAALPTAADFCDGDHWGWRQVDDLTGAEDFRFGRNAVRDGESIFFRNRRGDTSFREAFVTGTSTDPDKPWRAWPLSIGARWSYAADWISNAGEPGQVTEEAEVVAFEPIDVIAGHFMAFRIEQKGVWRVRDHASHMFFSGRQIDVYWYAPTIKADVRHTRVSGGVHFSQELLEFRPGKC